MTRGAGKKEPEAMLPQAAKWAETVPYHAVTTDLRRLGGPPVGTDQGAGDILTRSEEHLQREGDSLLRGGPFGGYAMRRGDTGARSANLLRAS